MSGQVFLIPTFLYENALHVLPAYILEAVEKCSVLFAENERSARRYLKQLKRKLLSTIMSGLPLGKLSRRLFRLFAPV
ncbi:hypothetical protein LWM68_07950 [Niabella sp. W65]|nr:hypothetical protein [Niabella sp. W65]MCH7362705.1 hypothetical protein [Niabella sp. W65]ULT38660.1 hypothetical protein KRR40_26620 [Niabella sp. I65]